MQRLLSTYLCISKKLTPEILGQIAEADFQGLEIFCTRSHFEYSMKPEIRAMAGALEAHRLQLVSLHAPTSRDLSVMRRSEEHTSELQSHLNLVCRLLLEKKKKQRIRNDITSH